VTVLELREALARMDGDERVILRMPHTASRASTIVYVDYLEIARVYPSVVDHWSPMLGARTLVIEGGPL
jgi:hypothetical protein